MRFENEHTLKKHLKSHEEKAFHESYESAIKNVKSQFGKKYSMMINGKNVISSETFVDISPIDKRIKLGYFSIATTKHVQMAIKVAKTAFEKWRKIGYKSPIHICNVLRRSDIQA